MTKLSKKTKQLIDDYDTKAKDWGFFTERSPFSLDGIDKARKEYNDSKDKLIRRILFLERKINKLEYSVRVVENKKENYSYKVEVLEKRIEELEAADVSGKKRNRKA